MESEMQYQEYEAIYLAPVDPEWDEVQSEEERVWCSDGDVWDAPGVKFIRADLAAVTEAERALLASVMAYAQEHVVYAAAGHINSSKADAAWLAMMQKAALVDAERTSPTPPVAGSRAEG